MGAIFDSGSENSTSSSSNTKTNSTSTTTPFSGDALNNYNDYVNAAKNNYNNTNANLNSLLTSGKTKADTSKLDYAWGQYTGMNNDNLNKLNTQSYNPNDNADWVNAQNDIDSNARKQFGSTINKVNQNIIGTGMANGSGHQTAAYNAAANLSSQLASDRANRWTSQYNQNVQNTLAANGKLQDFYSKLSDIGVDYAKLSQEDMTTLLNAYNAQNDALKLYGQAVSIGSNPTTTTNSETNGTTSGSTSTTNSPSTWSKGLAIASLFA